MPEFFKVRIKRGNKGYGFVLSNQAPCVVSNVTEGGPADIALLQNGDEILEVNDENVSRSTHEHVVRLLLKSSAPDVKMLVCRYSEGFDGGDSLITMMDNKEDLHKSITETVDKVVQDLKGPLKLGKFFRNEKDSPKKISSLRDTSFEKSDFEDKVYGQASPQEAISDFNMGGGFKLLEESNSDILDGDFRIVVGYLQTIELPDSKNLSLTSQNVLTNCVKGLHVKSKKINKHFLMSVSSKGIQLSGQNNDNIVTYPLKTISYTCCCPDDERYFGIVTKKWLANDRSSSPYNTKKHNRQQQRSNVCSCHIFMIDPELCFHSKHETISKSFGINCHPNRQSNCCQEFPSNSAIILETLQSMFSNGTYSDSNSSLSLDVPSQTNLDDEEVDYELNLSEMLHIRDEKKLLKNLGKGNMEFKNFTRSPFKQRKPIPTTFYDKDDDLVDTKMRNEEEMTNMMVDSCGEQWPSVQDPCNEGRVKDVILFDDNMDGIKNDKKKEHECDQSLEMLLKNPFTLQCFEEFLKKEHSEENIMFWKAIENFRTISDPVKLRKTANHIYNTYLAGGAPGLVNVDQKAVKKAEENLINPDANMFNLQQQQIFMLMKYDCFPRFLKSEFNRRQPLTDEFEDDYENKDKKRKTQWHLKKKPAVKEIATKTKTESETNDQIEKKKTLLSLWSKGKGPKQDAKSRDKPPKPGKLRGRNDSQSSLSDSGSRPTTPNVKDDRKKFELPKSPSEIKQLLGCDTTFCRVRLPNGSSNVIMLERGKVIREVLQTCCSRQNLLLSAYDIYVNGDKKDIDLDKDSLFFADDVFHLEKKIQFRFDLPNKRSVAVRESSSAALFDVVEPIMRKNGYNIENFIVHLNQCQELVPLDCTIGSIENKHLITEPKTNMQAAQLSLGNVSWKPPTAGSMANKETKSSFKKQGSKDDYSLLSAPKLVSKPVKSNEELNKFVRRGSLEGHRSYFARLKQGIKNSRTTRSKSIDHTKYGLKASKSKTGNDNNKLTVSGPPLHERQNSAPSFSKLNDDEVLGFANSQEISERFRPASEMFYSKANDDGNDYFDRRASMPAAKFVRDSSSEYNQTEDSGSELSAPPSRKSLHVSLMRNLHPALSSALSEPDLAVRRGRTKNIKGISDDITRRNSALIGQTSVSKDETDGERNRSQKKLPKNLESWRARENSCDSASSSPGEERESNNTRKMKRDDAKRHSSPGLPSPRSPQNKQKKLSIEQAEIAIAHSPVYFDDVKKPRTSKARPLPISVANESEILRGLDIESYEHVSTPDIVIDDVKPDEMDDSFEGAIERFNRRKKKVDKNFESFSSTPKNLEKRDRRMEGEERGKGAEKRESTPGEKSSDGSIFVSPGSPSLLDSECNITVTGSVNDETLIMEDKETGLDLSELMDMTNMKRNRKIMKQRGEKEQKIKETAITFV